MEDYVIYPEALSALERSGLKERIDRSEGLPFFPSAFWENLEDDVIGDLEREGYIDTIPEDFVKEFLEQTGNPGFDFVARVRDWCRAEEKQRWCVRHDGGESEISLTDADWAVPTGVVASHLLEPEEMWDLRPGFLSLHEMFGVMGAYAMEKRGFMADTAYESVVGERRFRTSINGFFHGDPFIAREDISSYPTWDPMGQEVRYRPRAFSSGMAFHHSSEPIVFATALQVADHYGLECRIQTQEDVERFLAEHDGVEQHVGNYADFGDFSVGVRNMFLHAVPDPREPLPTFQWPASGAKEFTVACDEDGNMRSFDGDEMYFSLPREEIGQFMHLVFRHCLASGQSRTSAAQLVDLLEYKITPDYEEDMERLRRMAE